MVLGHHCLKQPIWFSVSTRKQRGQLPGPRSLGARVSSVNPKSPNFHWGHLKTVGFWGRLGHQRLSSFSSQRLSMKWAMPMNHPYKVATTGTKNLGPVGEMVYSLRSEAVNQKSHWYQWFRWNFHKNSGFEHLNTFQDRWRQHSSPKQEWLYKRGMRTVFRRSQCPSLN